MNAEFKPHISKEKRNEVEDIKRLLQKYPVVAIVNLEGLPGLMLQRIKHRLKDIMELKITKKSMIKIAFDEVEGKKDIKQLQERLDGIPALIFSSEDPFMLYNKIEKSKASSPAKPGQKAPEDLKMEAGPTPFTPGPMIGELGMLGIKTEVKEGKIYVKDERVLAKEGEVISEKAANLLSKLGVEPMKVGLNVLLTYKDGEVLEKDVLAIDEDEYIDKIKTAHANALALAIRLGMVNDETAKPMVMRAFREAKALDEKLPHEDAKKEDPKPEPAEPPKEEQPKEESVEEKAKPVDTPKEDPKPTEEKKETVQKQPEPVKEEPELEPVKEQPKPIEPPKEESKPIEPPKEQPVEPPKQEVKEPVQEKAPEPVKEQPKPEPQKEAQLPPQQSAKKEDIQRAQDQLQSILKTGSPPVAQKSSEVKEKREVDDINKFINELKDKKSKGEL